MMKEFDMTDLGRMRYFLGLEVLQRADGIFICQKKYAQEVLERFNMVGCNAVSNPIVPGFKLVTDSAGMTINNTQVSIFKQLREYSVISRGLSHMASFINQVAMQSYLPTPTAIMKEIWRIEKAHQVSYLY